MKNWVYGISGVLLVFPLGCGYTTDTLYRTYIKTIFIPVFESQSFRRQVEFDLTGAVSRQIDLHTPYKVVSDLSRADSILQGGILSIGETVLAQQRELDRPLENQVILTVSVNWKDLRNGDLIIENQIFQVSGDYAALLSSSSSSATRQAVNELAGRIVEKMEKPW